MRLDQRDREASGLCRGYVYRTFSDGPENRTAIDPEESSKFQIADADRQASRHCLAPRLDASSVLRLHSIEHPRQMSLRQFRKYFGLPLEKMALGIVHSTRL